MENLNLQFFSICQQVSILGLAKVFYKNKTRKQNICISHTVPFVPAKLRANNASCRVSDSYG